VNKELAILEVEGNMELIFRANTNSTPRSSVEPEGFFSLQERIGLRNVLILLHRMDLFSLLMYLFAVAELVPAYSLTF
jgi:hypothetical protein